MKDAMTEARVRMRRGLRGTLAACFLLCGVGDLYHAAESHASVRTIEAEGEYRMSAYDTRESAERLATEAARRNALEQVAVYVESVTVVRNSDVTMDEIRSYTAGVVSILDHHMTIIPDGDSEVIHVNLTAEVDPDQAVRAITALRQDENARHEVLALRAEVDRLHRALEETNQSLASASTPAEERTLTQQRQQLLNQVQSNTMLAQAWTSLVVVTPAVALPEKEMRKLLGLVTQATRLTPDNPHLGKLQDVITVQPAAHQKGLPPTFPLQPLQPPPPLSAPSMAPLQPPQPMRPPQPMTPPTFPSMQPPQPLTPRSP
jgi:hypothetical protein